MPDVSKPARQLDDPYIFVSYAHLDRQRVQAILKYPQQTGLQYLV